MKTINIVGAGLIGQERIKAVSKMQARGLPVGIGWVHDPFHPFIKDLAAKYSFQIEPDFTRLLQRSADLLVIACPHDVAVTQACLALEAGHAILYEKPLGRSLQEAVRIQEVAKMGRGVFVGMNYRFMPGIAALVADWRAQRFGNPISLRLELGHGGKSGDEKTWKLDPNRCGGGALLDPGIHLLDLCCQLERTAKFEIVAASSWEGFWKTGIEEDLQILLKNGNLRISISLSVVRWRSHFEIFALGADGYGTLTGRGRSYGLQSYRRGRRWGWQSAQDQISSEELVLEDACEDSFCDELAACLQLTKSPALAAANLDDGLMTMRLYDEIKRKMC
jgi:predicted dehydrogenase